MEMSSFDDFVSTCVILTAEYTNKVDRIFLVSVIFTTIGIYFHFLWNSIFLLIGLVTSIVGLRSIKPWNKMRRLFFLMTCELVTGASMVRLLDSAHPMYPSTVGNRSNKPWNKMGRQFLLMTFALYSGASIVRMLESGHPVKPSVVMCVFWIVSLPFMSIKFINQQLKTDLKYLFEPELRLSGFGILIILYAFGISMSRLEFQWFLGIEFLGALLWFGILKIIHNVHEDDEDSVLRTFYNYIAFIDLSTFVMLLFQV